MEKAELVGSKVKFSYCSLERARALWREQYAVGTVSVKIVQPMPYLLKLSVSSTLTLTGTNSG